MGQDTYANIGVFVDVELTMANLATICQLLEDKDINCYIHDGECDDEIKDFRDLLDECDVDRVEGLKTLSKEQLDELIDNLEDDVLHFIIFATSAYARNISRRLNSQIFGPEPFDVASSVEETINSFTAAKHKFLDNGFTSDQIKVGYRFLDCS